MQKTILTIMVMLGCYLTGMAQKTTELTIFAENGEKFYLIVDGEKQNAAPAAKVKMPGLSNEWYKVKIIFEDDKIPSIDDRVQTKGYTQSQSYEQAKQITYVIKDKGKGKHVLRSSSWTFFDGTETATTTTTSTGSGSNTSTANTNTNTGTHTTTTQQTTTSTGGGDGMNMNMSVGTNGVSVTDPEGHTVKMDVNMDPNNPNVNVNTNVSGGTTTTVKTTTTTRTTTSTPDNNASINTNTNNSTASTGTSTSPKRCTFAMSASDFAGAKNSINNQSFAEEKMKVAKQIVKAKCVNAAQVKEMMALFSFEENKLDFAKYAYDYTIDKDNYYQINDAFSFSSSVDDLNKYLEGKQ